MSTSILLIDDEARVRTVLAGALESAGYHVIELDDGRQAVAIARREAPCIVITDIFMPGMDGLEVIRALRASGLDIKILAISGGGRPRQPNVLEIASHMGADRVLAKPFSTAALLRSVALLTSGT